MVFSMEPVTRESLLRSFGRECERVVLPDTETVDWQNLDYLGWIHPAGHLAYMVVLSPETGKLTGSILSRQRMISTRRRYEMCSWCHHVHESNGTAMFSLTVKGTEGRHLLGKVLCKDLDCSLRIRDLVDPPSLMNETRYKEARIWRMQTSMHRWLKKANRL